MILRFRDCIFARVEAEKLVKMTLERSNKALGIAYWDVGLG